MRDKGTKLSTMIRKSIETPDWLHMKEPRDRRMVIGVVMQEIQIISSELTKIIGLQFGLPLSLDLSLSLELSLS